MHMETRCSADSQFIVPWCALALVRREAEPGMIVGVGERGATAEVTELPFFRLPA